MPSDDLKLSLVDELVRGDHWYLRAEDQCLFLREYTSHVGFTYSDTNDLISNLKKPMGRRANPAEWKWKGWAIRKAGAELAEAFARDWKLEGAVLVPVPPSCTKANPEYDDRMVQVANILGQKLGLPVVELLEAVSDRVAQHTSDKKRSIQDQVGNLQVRADRLPSSAQAILLVDDVLVTGCTFVASKTALHGAFPRLPVCGLFIARRRILEEPLEPPDAS